jgi:signal transduction histidine kinase
MNLRERLRPRLLLSHISLATIPVLILGILLIQTTRESIETTVSDGNFEVAKRASNEIRLYIEQAQNVVSQVADNMGMLDTTPIERQRLIDNVVVRHDQFKVVAVLDLEGNELFCTQLSSHDPAHLKAGLELPAADGVTISPVSISEDRLPSVRMTAPVIRFNQVTGYVTADVNLKDMWDLVDSVQIGGDSESGLGDAYVLSANGRLIAHPQRERVYGQEDMSATPVGLAISRSSSNTVLYNGSDGERIAAFVTIEPLGWHVVIEQPTAEAFVRSREAIVEVTVLMIFSALAASLIGVFFARKIARPVSQLVRGANQFGKGELTHTIDVPGQGELTTLAEEFNHMARLLLEKERQLQRAERLATLSKFASILSHEIRNPLNSMMVNLQVLRREMDRLDALSPKNRKYYDIVVSEIWRIDGLVEDFLTYARPQELNRFENNIVAIVAAAIETHENTARERGITIDADYSSPQIFGAVDADQIKQVILNLMLNAFDAMEEGGALSIKVDQTTPAWTGDLTADSLSGPFATITVTDSGCGVAEEQLAQIFEMYFTSKSNGTGLGLPIAQQIVEKHGGKIEVVSAIDEGATFTVWLPLEAMKGATETEKQQSEFYREPAKRIN